MAKPEFNGSEPGSIEFVDQKIKDSEGKPVSLSSLGDVLKFEVFGRPFKIRRGNPPSENNVLSRSEANGVIASSRNWEMFQKAWKEMESTMEDDEIRRTGLSHGSFLLFVPLVEVGRRQEKSKNAPTKAEKEAKDKADAEAKAKAEKEAKDKADKGSGNK